MPNDRFDHLFLSPGDYDAALAFYRDALGWSVTASWGGAGRVRPTLHLVVEDLDARYREVSACGRVVVEPEATHWGVRWFVMRDPDDNLIAFLEAPNAK